MSPSGDFHVPPTDKPPLGLLQTMKEVRRGHSLFSPRRFFGPWGHSPTSCLEPVLCCTEPLETEFWPEPKVVTVVMIRKRNFTSFIFLFSTSFSFFLSQKVLCSFLFFYYRNVLFIENNKSKEKRVWGLLKKISPVVSQYLNMQLFNHANIRLLIKFPEIHDMLNWCWSLDLLKQKKAQYFLPNTS